MLWSIVLVAIVAFLNGFALATHFGNRRMRAFMREEIATWEKQRDRTREMSRILSGFAIGTCPPSVAVFDTIHCEQRH